MKKGTVVLCQIEIKPDNGELVIILGTFGIVTDTRGIDGYEVQFADHEEPLSVSARHITPLGNDNWNDLILRQQYENKMLRTFIDEQVANGKLDLHDTIHNEHWTLYLANTTVGSAAKGILDKLIVKS